VVNAPDLKASIAIFSGRHLTQATHRGGDVSTAFTPERLARIAAAPERSPEARLLSVRSEFRASLSDGETNVVLAVGNGAVSISHGPQETDFTLTASAQDWEHLFAGTGGPQHASIFGMFLAPAVAGGVIAPVLEAGGNLRKLFAHGRTLEAIIAAGREA
jgi:hypothetical protein